MFNVYFEYFKLGKHIYDAQQFLQFHGETIYVLLIIYFHPLSADSKKIVLEKLVGNSLMIE